MLRSLCLLLAIVALSLSTGPATQAQPQPQPPKNKQTPPPSPAPAKQNTPKANNSPHFVVTNNGIRVAIPALRNVPATDHKQVRYGNVIYAASTKAGQRRPVKTLENLRAAAENYDRDGYITWHVIRNGQKLDIVRNDSPKPDSPPFEVVNGGVRVVAPALRDVPASNLRVIRHGNVIYAATTKNGQRRPVKTVENAESAARNYEKNGSITWHVIRNGQKVDVAQTSQVQNNPIPKNNPK